MVGRMSWAAAAAMSTSLLDSPRVALISNGMAITATSSPATSILRFGFIACSGSEQREQGHDPVDHQARQHGDEHRRAPARAEPGLPAERGQEPGPEIEQAEALGQLRPVVVDRQL